jgi:uncharacterized membrane protein
VLALSKTIAFIRTTLKYIDKKEFKKK